MTSDDTKHVQLDVDQVEETKAGLPELADMVPHHYAPSTEEEKALDRNINLKLDLCVVTILAIAFILCGSEFTHRSSLSIPYLHTEMPP